MIQRIQTLWLLLAIALYSYLASCLQLMQVECLLHCFVMLAGILSVGTILLFKKRKWQLKLLVLAIGVAIITTAYWVCLSMQAAVIDWNISILIGAIVFKLIAYKKIQEDEALIKSLDRLR